MVTGHWLNRLRQNLGHRNGISRSDVHCRLLSPPPIY